MLIVQLHHRANSARAVFKIGRHVERMDGFGVVEAVGADKMPAVIFVTAHDQYAIRAFEISAVDYLLKPVTEERFRIAFERARRRLGAAPGDEPTRQLLTVLDAMANPPCRNPSSMRRHWP